MVLLVQWYNRFLYNGIEISGIQSRIRIESFSMNNETTNNEMAEETNENKKLNKR
jgi:hypothetical protein